jgi:hypothetical protein
MTPKPLAICAAFSIFAYGCAGGPLGPSVPAGAEEVRIFEPAQLRSQDYETVKRLWVESWRSVFWVPESSSAELGVASLRAEAGRLGANAMTDVSCYANKGGQFTLMPMALRNPVFICYGTAVRVNQQR